MPEKLFEKVLIYMNKSIRESMNILVKKKS